MSAFFVVEHNQDVRVFGTFDALMRRVGRLLIDVFKVAAKLLHITCEEVAYSGRRVLRDWLPADTGFGFGVGQERHQTLVQAQ